MNYPPNVLALFAKLNEYQRAVADVGEGLACVIGNPGSGKTGSLIARIARLIYDGLPPQYILAMTFTRAAATEMSERLKALGLHGARVSTIHSLCRQILAESHLHLLDHVTVDEKGGLLIELRKIMGEFRKKNKIGWTGVDFEAVTRFISACKAESFSYVASDPFSLNMRAETAILHIASKYSKAAGIRPQVLRDLFFEQERRREIAGKMDFDDMLSWAWMTLLTSEEDRLRWRNRYSVVITDETQDSSPVQWDVSRLLAGMDSCIRFVKELPDKWQPKMDTKSHNLMTVGDVSQCLDGATQITTQDGTSPLETIIPGQYATASVHGKPVYRKVLKKGDQIKHSIVKITLEDGRQLVGSTDHLVFLAIPKASEYFHTYLQYNYEFGFRVGNTSSFKAVKSKAACWRLKEGGGNLLWLLDAHSSEAAAILHKEQLALRHSLTDAVYTDVNSKSRILANRAEQLFAEFGSNGRKVLNAYHMLFNRPVHITQRSFNHAHSYVLQSLTITHVVGSLHGSEILLESSALADLQVRKRISDELGYTVIAVKDRTWLIRKRIKDSALAQQFVCSLQRILEETLRIPVNVRMTLANAVGPEFEKFTASTLSGAVPGLYVWTQKGVAKKIIAHEHIIETRELHDIEIESATNYFANGIAVHNSIYSWRSATPSLFMDFWKRDDVQKLNLPINYRSNNQICKASSELVKGKAWHLGGEIVAHDKTEVTNKIKTVHYDTVENEAAHVVSKCKELAIDDGLRSCAILARLKVSLDLAEIECIRHRIKYIKMASGSFFESKETQAILGYLRVAGGWDPDGRWLHYIINQPFRFIGKELIRKGEMEARTNGLPLLDALLGPCASEMNGRQRTALEELRKLLLELNSMIIKAEMHNGNAAVALKSDPKEESDPDILRGKLGPVEGITLMLRKTKYLEALRREEGLIRFDESKETAIEALRRISSQFLSYREFLGYVDQIINAVTRARKTGLRLSEGATDDALILSTAHRSKGLEFKHVFIIDTTEGTFPCSRAEDMDEELRLFYVAVTRAAKTCEVSWSGDASTSRSVFVKKLSTILGEPGGDLEPSKQTKPPAARVSLPQRKEVKYVAKTLPPRMWEGLPKIVLTIGVEGEQNAATCVNVSSISAVGFWRTFKPKGDISADWHADRITEDEFKARYIEQLKGLSIVTWIDLIGMGRSRSNTLQFVDRKIGGHAQYLVEFLTLQYPEVFERKSGE